MRAFDAHDRADADGRIQRRPEMEFVRRVGLSLGGDDAAERRRARLWMEQTTMQSENRSCSAGIRSAARHHITARRNSSQSRIPYTMLSHRASGNATGETSARIRRGRVVGATRRAIVVVDRRLRQSRRAPNPTSDRVRPDRASGDTSSRRSCASATSPGNARPFAGAKREHDLEVPALDIQRSVILHDADHAVARRQPLVGADSAVDEQRRRDRRRTTARPARCSVASRSAWTR